MDPIDSIYSPINNYGFPDDEPDEPCDDELQSTTNDDNLLDIPF